MGIDLPDFNAWKEEAEERLKSGEDFGLDWDATRTPQEIIENIGLEFEEHKFHTEDRYIITTWRVYNSTNRNGIPILLHHASFTNAH